MYVEGWVEDFEIFQPIKVKVYHHHCSCGHTAWASAGLRMSRMLYHILYICSRLGKVSKETGTGSYHPTAPHLLYKAARLRHSFN